ncbi:MAG: SUMF1/EgtB/PvdO family nonheme iron enzyme, partial [Myxococcales bacterium]|nr:SUMF1/EgtB/PvdO family nonheme iron enzyme [Myxococcales bacterium]
WEKAARGVDGRAFPMGDTLIPPWANVAQSTREAPALRPVDDHPLDRSPYGVLGLAGNVRDTCRTRYVRRGQVQDGQRLRPEVDVGDGGLWEVRGGSLISPPIYCRASGRFAVTPDEHSSAGLRLARSWPGEP